MVPLQFAFDLHMHSCLSPCGGEDNTPANLAGMCALAGLKVHRLQRVREGGIELGDLACGKWRKLTADELAVLRKE